MSSFFVHQIVIFIEILGVTLSIMNLDNLCCTIDMLDITLQFEYKLNFIIVGSEKF